ncbi:MAG: class I SAM-dependent methyltransferase, partial [Bacteroidota bacterium]
QWLDEDGEVFQEVNGVHRFVKSDNYTANFGFQWNKFQRTQLDKYSENSQSQERFFAVTGWDKLDMRGENVLEVGSGAGRFTQVVLDHTQANLYSVDYSNAVEANYRNNGHHERLRLFQASIYELPFAKECFDRVFCFGVLQHTPDFKKSVQCLLDMVKPGGEVVIDFYPIRGFWTKIHAKYLFRPFTKGMNSEKLLKLIERNADWLIAASALCNRLGIGKFTNRFLPICDIQQTLPGNLTHVQLREWVILDTFDMFSPQYDNPQRIETVKKWLLDVGLNPVQAGFVSYGKGNQVAVVKAIK